MAHTAGTGRRLPSLAFASASHARALEQLHHEERDAVVGDVVVDDGDDARVLDRVGDVPLAEEALPQALAQAELRVEHLDRELRAVAVRGRVDRGHAADAEHVVDVVLVPDRRPDALSDARFQLPVHHALSIRRLKPSEIPGPVTAVGPAR